MTGVLDFTQFRAEDGSNTKRRVQGLYVPPTAAAGGYTTNGDIVLPADFKLGQLDYLDIGNFVTAAGTLYTVVYDYVNQKIMIFVGTTGVQAANALDLSASSCRFEAIGR